MAGQSLLRNTAPSRPVAEGLRPGLTHAEISLAWLKSPSQSSGGWAGDCPGLRSHPVSPSSAALWPLGISRKQLEGCWVPAALCQGARARRG